jgi:hypothetical protein
MDTQKGSPFMFPPAEEESVPRWLKKKAGVLVGLFLISGYILPVLILREETYIHVHDNLDSLFLYHHHLANSGSLFNFSPEIVLGNIMNGLPIWCLPSSMIPLLLFYVLGSFYGYIANDLLVRIIGYAGSYLLLKRYIFPEPENQIIVFAISAFFALIPFESLYGISVSGQPLLFYAFLNILEKRETWGDYLSILFFSFYEWFAMAGIFIFIGLGMILLIDCLKKKEFNYRYFAWMFIFLATCFLAEYKIFHAVFFNSDAVPHRVEWNAAGPGAEGLLASISDTLKLLSGTQYHTGAFRTEGILLTFGLALFISLKKREGHRLLIWIPLGILSICIFCGFYGYIGPFLERNGLFPFMNGFQWDRFYFLLPFLWFIMLAVSIRGIRPLIQPGPVLYLLLVFNLTLVFAANGEYLFNLSQVKAKISGRGKIHESVHPPNFRQFFAERLFSEVRDYINLPVAEYRVVSLGMHPSIVQFNGFYTLDSYQNIYPLKYKKQFRAIIAKELEKDRGLKKYFDSWGSRCYILNLAPISIK